MDYNFNRLAFKVNDEFLNSYYYNELTGHSANWEIWSFDENYKMVEKCIKRIKNVL